MHLLAFCLCGLSIITLQAQEESKKIKINKTPTRYGKKVNTAFDDFAPAIIGTLGKEGDSLIVTSNRSKREQIYVIPMADKDDSESQVVGESFVLFNRKAIRNIGGVIQANEHRGERTYVFASSGVPDKQTARFFELSGADVKGGSDLFEKVSRSSASNLESIRNIEELNSTAWDSHPTIGLHESGVEMIVFSSDRTDTNGGFSAPYENALYTFNGIQRKGNADLFVSFRRIGSPKWGKPMNLALLQGNKEINTQFNEYSPFLYCLNGTPHLMFSSNRSGNYELYYALLDIDFYAIAQNNLEYFVSVTDVFPLGDDKNDISSPHDELFPFVRYQEPDTNSKTVTQELWFSSDRFGKSKPDSAKKEGMGKLDIYRTEATFFCGKVPPKPCPPCEPCDPAYPCAKPPKPCAITYNVTILDNASNDTTVKDVLLTVMSDVAGKIERKGNTYSLHIPADSMITRPNGVVFTSLGRSTYDRKPCQDKNPVITNYNGMVISRTITAVKDKSRKEQFDSLVQDKPVKAQRIARLYDTILVEQFETRPLRKKLNERVEILDSRRLKIGRDTVTFIDSLPPLRKAVFSKAVAYKDTTYSYDTSFVSSTVQNIASTLTRFEPLRVPRTMVKADDSCRTMIVNDTIRLYAQFGQSPCCITVDSVIVFGAQRNVPYFQTAFWEVNTSKGYAQHMQRLREGDLKEASWIELNYRNKYWGNRGEIDRTDLMAMRRADYREKAKIIDRNIQNMVDSTSDLLKKFWKIYEKNDTAKVIITMTAYSDIRPIGNGSYISDNEVKYISSAFDTVKYQFANTQAIEIKSGASLKGEDNDTLSKLRAYYGYQAVMNELSKDSLFSVLKSKGLVITPTDGFSVNQYDEKIKKARVIVLAEGKYIDTSVIPEVSAYKRSENSYYDLDGVRRVDVSVRLINLRPDLYAFPDCCVQCK
ncbi:MAG: hypothetical protein ACO3DH_09130 [Candidatus Kapaibacteriota bacterium]